MKLKIKQAFTLVELIVVITILAILGTIAFIAMSGYSKTARDSTRTSDMSKIKTSLELFHLNSDKYPDPTELWAVTYSGGLAWNQGTFGNSTFMNVEKLDKIPLDPLTEKEYTYSVLNTKQEYELAGIIEGDDIAFLTQTYAADKTAKAKIVGTYNGVSLRVNTNDTSYILAIPSIITSIDLAVETNRALETIIPNKELVIADFQNLPPNYINSLYNSKTETTNNNFKLIKNNDISNILIYEGNVDNLTPTELITNLQNSYTGTTIATIVPTNELFNIDITNGTTELETIDTFGVNFINNNLGGAAQTKIYATCDGIAHNTIKAYYTQNSTPFPTLCETVKQDFVCIDGTWKNVDTDEVLNTTTYPYDTCIEAGALNCDADPAYLHNTHTYNIPSSNHDDIQDITSNDVLENNGTYTYSLNVTCYNNTFTDILETGPTLVSCDTNYTPNGNTCEASTQLFTCTAKPTNSIWNTVGSYTQTWSGTEWLPVDTTTIYNETSSTTSCNYTCDTGYYDNAGTSCDPQWTGDGSTTGYLFKDTSGVEQYPLSCSDLLTNVTLQNTLVGSPWNGSKFNDGVYYIRPDVNPAFEVYCDMTSEGGGWTRYTNIKGNYTLDDALSCFKGNHVNNAELECFNPNRFNISANEYKVKIGGNDYISEIVYNSSFSTNTTVSTRYCTGQENYFTVMNTGEYPGAEPSSVNYVWLGRNYCKYRRQVGGKSGTTYMNYSYFGDGGPIHGTREDNYQASELFIRNTDYYKALELIDGGYMFNTSTYARSCNDYINSAYYNNEGNGTYWIKPNHESAFKVYCDMTTDGGGWTQIINWQGGANGWANFQSIFETNIYNNVDNISDNTDYLRLKDSTCDYDVFARKHSINIPNSGEIRAYLKNDLISYEAGAMFLLANTEDGLQNIKCVDAGFYNNYNGDDTGTWKILDASYMPWGTSTGSCPDIREFISGKTYYIDEWSQKNFGKEITDIHYRSFEACSGDDHYLYSMILYIR